MANTLTGHQLSALDTSDNIALTANAGSGKTFVLSKRFLEIALNKDVPLRKIAAITFTEKAASELYRKIAGEVEILIKTEPALKNKLQQIRRGLVSANISTIHSFCINLLKEYPVEADLDANFTPIDPNTSNELIELSVEETIKAALISPADSGKIKSLIRLLGSRKNFSGELIRLIDHRKNLLELKEKLYSKSTEEIADFFYEKFISISSQYISIKLPGILQIIEKVTADVLAVDKSNRTALEAGPLIRKIKDERRFENLINIICELKKLICIKEGNFRSVFVKKVLVDADDESAVQSFFSDAAYFSADPRHRETEMILAAAGKDFIYFFDAALKRYEEKKKSKGYLDFEDILLNTRKLLEDEKILGSIRGKFDYLMIDEYQDTNEIQYEIFLPILDYLKRGNLFVVGDEKQSIYMFRDAELEVFEKTKNLMRETESGKVLVLPDSFRMGPEICLFTNHIFSRLFSVPDIMFNEVAHSDLVCARKEIKPGGVSFLLSDPDGILEADLVSAKILEIISAGSSWNDIAILTRKRKSFDELEASFVAHNIPYLIMGGRNFYQRQCIYDIHNYFAFLLDNENDAALAGVLRSPFFGLSDSKLYEISLAKGFNFYQKLLNTDDRDLDDVKSVIAKMVSGASYKDAPELLREMIDESDLISYLASKKNGSQETANIRKLVKLTIDFYAYGFRTLYDYLNFLQKNIEQTEDESQAVLADDSNTVKIMTVHQAKGLEFPVVFLFRSSETALKNVVKQKSLFINKELGVLTKVPLNENYFEDYISPPVVNLSDFISLKKSDAELKRLLYVGVTRAKDYLFITACKKENYAADSFMGLIMKALGDEFSFNGFSVNGKLKYLKIDESICSEVTKDLLIEIPVVSDLVPRHVQTEEKENVEKLLKTEKLSDSVKGEIISASRYSVYKHCPLKYKFTYIDKLLPVIKHPVIPEEISDSEDVDAASVSAGTKGRIIHSILQDEKGIPSKEYIKNLITAGENDIYGSVDLAAEDIISDLQKYFASGTYKLLSSQQSRNEYEVYFSEKDYILFGIIDKLIIEEGIITIIDYKTDDITEEKTTLKAEEYFNQLKFYSYIIWNVFNRSYRVQFRIIFIKHPEIVVKKVMTDEDLTGIGRDIAIMIDNTRAQNFHPDFTHCRNCIYSPDHKNCIKIMG